MELKNLNIQSYNIVLIFEELDMNNLSFDSLNKNFDNEIKIHKVQKDLAIIVFEEEKIQAQIGQNRIILGVKKEIIFDEINFLPDYLDDIIDSLNNVNLKSYGFNFDGNGFLNYDEEYDAGLYFIKQFGLKEERINEVASGHVLDYNPQFSISYDNYIYNIKLKTRKNKNFKFHLNVHYNLSELEDNWIELSKEHFMSFNDILINI